jgi:hypothetical protein
MHHPRRASTSLEAKLGNTSLTYFHVKQDTRSRRVPRADSILLSIFWSNRQIVARLVLRRKLRNRRGDFETQITKP